MTALARICGAFYVALLLLAAPLAAQSDLAGEFERWDRLATRAEAVVQENASNDSTLEALRSSVADFRADFDAARDVNSDRIAVLRNQVAALGPAPEGENAEPEAPDVAAKRTELTAQINTLLVPEQRAEAEFVRANALVGQIDKILRERQAEALLTLSPSPLNPAHWQPAVQDFFAAANALWNENPEIETARSWVELRQTLPVVIVLALLGLILILRGRRWSKLIVQYLQRFGARGFGIWRFLVSLLRIFLPFAGLVLLALAAIATNLFGAKGNEILLVLSILCGVMLTMRWISERVFSREDDEALILVTHQKRAEARFQVSIITGMIVLSELALQVLSAEDTRPASELVLVFIPLIISCLSLYRIGVILRGYHDETIGDDETGDGGATETRQGTMRRMIRLLGTGSVLVAVASVVLLVAGYYNAADALLPPYIMTLAVLGLVMTLQRFSADVYGALTGLGTQARDALMPVLFGMALLLLSAPPLALIWGARVTDLTELWSAFGRGFSFGETRISPTDFVAFAVIFAIGYALTRLVQSALRGNVLPKTKIDIGGQNAIVSGIGYTGIFLAALAAITGAGIDLSSLAIVAGALSVGIGFGLQNIVSNFVSGIILLIERPISEGDWIEVGGQMGHVRDISVRSTRIETFDRTDVIVPNADLVSGTVTNFTRGNTVGRVIVQVGVAYGSDTRKVDRILREIAEAQPMVLANPPPTVVFVGLGASTYDFEIRAILRDVNWVLAVKNDINHAIVERFNEESIEIAFPQLDVWMRNAGRPDAQPRDESPEQDATQPPEERST